MFNDLGLSEATVKVLTKAGFSVPTEIQEKGIPVILAGKDMVGRSQTGSGKTLAFGLPAIELVNIEEKGVEVLIVCPTRELATQVCDEVRKVASDLNIKVTPIFGGADMTRQIKAIKNTKIVVGTPGRIMDHLRRKTLKLHNVKMVVLDEADEMLNMGFREDIETILKEVPSQRQTVMFSATMPPAIKNITKEYQKEPVMIEIGQENRTIDKIEQQFIYCKKDEKVTSLIKIFRELNPKECIVFCNTKKMVEKVVEVLQQNGVTALGLHGDMHQGQRKNVMDSMKKHKNQTNILVATDVAARGIDINDVDFVINFDLPNNLEYYIHRIGRTGRAGKSGRAITIINTKPQLKALQDIQRDTKSKMTEMFGNFSANVRLDNVKAEERTPRRGGSQKNNNKSERKLFNKDEKKYTERKFDERPAKKSFENKTDKKERKQFNKPSFEEKKARDYRPSARKPREYKDIRKPVKTTMPNEDFIKYLQDDDDIPQRRFSHNDKRGERKENRSFDKKTKNGFFGRKTSIKRNDNNDNKRSSSFDKKETKGKQEEGQRKFAKERTFKKRKNFDEQKKESPNKEHPFRKFIKRK